MKSLDRFLSYSAKIVALVIIIQMAGCAMVYRSTKKRLQRNYREGIAFYKKGKYADALDRFETAYSIDPDYRDSRHYIVATKEAMTKKTRGFYVKGIQAKRNGDYEEALDMFLRAQKEDEDYKDLGDQIKSVRDSKQIKKKYETAYKSAERNYTRKKYQDAYRDCLRAEKYNPGSLELSLLMRKVDSALSDRSSPMVSKAKDLYGKNKYEAAKAQLNRALGVNPWDKDAKELLAKIDKKLVVERNYQAGKEKYQAGDFAGALENFSSVVDREPGYRDASRYIDRIKDQLSKNIPQYFNAGVTYYDNEQFSEAIAEFNKILRLDSGHQKAREYKDRAIAKLEIKKSLGAE